jgi:hypothetical protein
MADNFHLTGGFSSCFSFFLYLGLSINTYIAEAKLIDIRQLMGLYDTSNY